ncbi:putative toxoplasma gondii family B protein, partial [Toxoplasma gondii CAST]
GCGRSTGRELSVCAEDYKAQFLEAIVEAGTLTGYWIRRASRTEGQPACVTCTKCHSAINAFVTSLQGGSTACVLRHQEHAFVVTDTVARFHSEKRRGESGGVSYAG